MRLGSASFAGAEAAVQLAVYRLAWAALSGCPESSVRTAFYYVRAGVTVVPDELPDAAELAGLLAQSVGVNVIPWSGSGLTVPDITIPADVVRARRARCDGGSPR